MKAARLLEYKEPLEIADVDRPSAPDNGVIIDIEASGICRSDWHFWQGHFDNRDTRGGSILGHEPAGEVVEVGPDVEGINEGDNVTVPFNYADGTCPTCRQGHTHLCDRDIKRNGAWAEEIAVPWGNMNTIKLPDSVSPRKMAGLGCRFMTAFHGLAHRADITAGDWVAVHGCGGVGLSGVNIANALGGNVVAVDLDDEKLDMAENLGAAETVNASEVDDVAGEVQDITDGGAAVSVDALGIAETTQNSINSLQKRGQHIQLGLPDHEDGTVTVPAASMVFKEIDFRGSLGMPTTQFDEIFRMIENDKVQPEKLITKEVSLDDVNDRLEAMSNFETKGMEVITDF
jgi:D-arabinose 1-dehydrogenase-like Zn-dependent alcohol dehydrogenase